MPIAIAPDQAVASGPDVPVSRRAIALAATLEQGARALAAFAATLSDEEWRWPLPHDGRPLGVIVHHVASIYPLEVELAEQIAAGAAIEGVSWADVHVINARHAAAHAGVTREEALTLLHRNSRDAADAIRALSDEQLEATTTNSLYGGAPLTCQFMLEDHAVRHAYHHLARIRTALQR